MIYLIDDTPRDQIERSLSLEACSDVMTRLETVDVEDRVALASADCIMMHYSFRDSDLLKQVRDDISGYGEDIPLVFFSDGDLAEAVFYDDTFRWIQTYKKGVMYSRLQQFLDFFRSSGRIDLRVLAYGGDFVRTEANRLSEALLSPVMFFGAANRMDMGMLNPADLFAFVNLSQPALGITAEEILADDVTVAEFRTNITSVIESFNRYGKNIHHWK